MKSRSKNPIFLIISLLVPWRFINTWYYLHGETLFISRYYAIEKSRFFKKELLEIDIKTIDKIGLSGDFGIQPIEPMLQGYYGRYKSQEIVFILTDGKKIAWNVRFYTKKQLVELFKLIKKDIIFGSKLRYVLKL